MRYLILLAVLAVLLQLTAAGPLASAVTFAFCVEACLLIGTVGFAIRAASANPAAGLPVPAVGAGIYVTCEGMCMVISSSALLCPTP